MFKAENKACAANSCTIEFIPEKTMLESKLRRKKPNVEVTK